MIQSDTITAPAFLASALINGDESGFDEEGRDAATLARLLERLGDWRVVDIARDEETGESVSPRFTWHYKLHGGDASGGEVLDYIVHRDANDSDSASGDSFVASLRR